MITAAREFERARDDTEGSIFTQAVLKGLSEDKAERATGENVSFDTLKAMYLTN